MPFLLAAVFGVAGGLIAAIALHPDPVVIASPSQQVTRTPTAQPTTAMPVERTTIVVPAVPDPRLSGQSTEEMMRLKNRNKRLEALVQVLRDRKANQPGK